jgi:capsular polysaccharide biosynthesis protein
MQSEIVLRKVVEGIDLNTRWSRKHLGNQDGLHTPDTLGLLKGRLEIRSVRNTSLIQIRVFSDEPGEPAEIANHLAKAYSDYAVSAPEGVQVQLVDTAVPIPRPVRPNKPLNIVLSAIVGGVLGLSAGALGMWLAVLVQRKHQAKSRP